MKYIPLGKTGLLVSKTSFGALPIQRINFDEAKKIFLAAYESGVNYFDTAYGYTDSEEKIANALSPFRDKLYIATKTPAKDTTAFWQHLETSLKRLNTSYIDVYQFHNPPFIPKPNDGSGLYEAMLEAKSKGLIRHIGITTHKLEFALEISKCGLYETLQFPFSVLSGEKDLEVVKECAKNGVGFVAMKAMSGGLLQSGRCTFSYIRQFENVVPIYGIQRMSELLEFLELEKNPPAFDDEMKAEIEKERHELSGNFCRACGYCLPCPQGIPIPTCARISLLLSRSPYKKLLTLKSKANVDKISTCINCGACKSRCPYSLDTPALLKSEQKKYYEFYNAHIDEAEKDPDAPEDPIFDFNAK